MPTCLPAWATRHTPRAMETRLVVLWPRPRHQSWLCSGAAQRPLPRLRCSKHITGATTFFIKRPFGHDLKARRREPGRWWEGLAWSMALALPGPSHGTNKGDSVCLGKGTQSLHAPAMQLVGAQQVKAFEVELR